MKVVVAGGAGFIGSHTVIKLVEAGHTPVVLDDFSNSRPTVMDRLDELTGRHIEWWRVNLRDKEKTAAIMERIQPDAVIHFAAYKAVAESVAKPIEYYSNNFESLLSVLSAMKKVGGKYVVFSSSATVYGDAPAPVTEDAPAGSASNPYGYTKVAGERIVTDVANATDMKAALLRYFNPVGAHESGRIGENPLGVPANLMPLILNAATGRLDKLKITGTDYPTPDGTAIRDYLHVMDLAQAHVAALQALANSDWKVRAWNIGTGKGTSVREMVDTFEEATGAKVPHEDAPRRPGDLPEIYANPARANEELGWKAELDLTAMCRDSWNWQSKNPTGYPEGDPVSQPEVL